MVYKAFAQGCKNHFAGVALIWKQCFMAKAVAAHHFSSITIIHDVLNIFDCACNIYHDHHVHIGIIVLHSKWCTLQFKHVVKTACVSQWLASGQ